MRPMKIISIPNIGTMKSMGFVMVSKGALMNIIGKERNIIKPTINKMIPAIKVILAGSITSLL
jgi:hypothetical protein